jgi:hypothetical protein
MGDEHEWMGRVAGEARFAANHNGREWFETKFVPSLPEEHRAFALGKLAEYERRRANAGAAAGEKHARSCPYRRAGLVPIRTVLANVGGRVVVEGNVVSCDSWRIHLYAAKGVRCAHCGMEGTTFAAERAKSQSTPKYHLNLYHVAEGGEETMITVDHIVPKSRGGGNHVSNLQPLCIKCNGRKGDRMPSDEAA